MLHADRPKRVKNLEGLTSGKERDMQRGGIVFKAPLATIFGPTLEVLSDSNAEHL